MIAIIDFVKIGNIKDVAKLMPTERKRNSLLEID